MLVYANQMTFSGKDAEEAVFKAVEKWFEEKLGSNLGSSFLKEGGVHDGRGDFPTQLKIYTATEQTPKLYSWVLTESDQSVHGRQWHTELGLKVLGSAVEFSCILKTEDRSAMISIRVMASKPRVIGYVIENICDSGDASFDGQFIGDAVKKVGEDHHSYVSFLAEIERKERHYPLVLISPGLNRKYLINPSHLQEQLVGLAQVVGVVHKFDRYEMKGILGTQWSAWDGSVNVIGMPEPNGHAGSRCFLAQEIEDWGVTQQDRVSRLLARITNDTNMAQRMNRIRPADVMHASRKRSEVTRMQIHKMQVEELRDELAKAQDDVNGQKEHIKQLKDENDKLEWEGLEIIGQLDEAKDDVKNKTFENYSLKEQLKNLETQEFFDYDPEYLVDLFLNKEKLNPEECLTFIGKLFKDNCVILPSARKSAKNANAFRNGKKLLGMLKKLVVEYRQALIEGKEGDAQANSIFGTKGFAARESQLVMGDKKKRQARTFEYQGENIPMFKHLKIGFTTDKSRTIRVHFHFDPIRKKIVIGYCGEHLPISSN